MDNKSTSPTASEYPREIFEPIITSPEMETLNAQEVSLCFYDLDGGHELNTCYGDILKIINALIDYSTILETVCDLWGLEGYHRAIYGYHADKLREIAEKYQASIHYDYYAALKKCRKKQQRQSRRDDIGEDALVLASRANTAPPPKTK